MDHYGDDPLATGLDPSLVLPVRIASWASREPDRPFMTEIGGRSVTYGQFFDEMLRWCEHLRRAGVKPGDRIASFLPASIDAQLLWIAASCIGAYEVAVNPDLRGEMLRHVLVDSGASRCFARDETAALAASADVDLPVEVVPRGGGYVDHLPAVALASMPEPADAACVIYTSGTTGPSKGAVITWGQCSAVLGRTPRSWFSGTDAIYAPLPMFHVTGRTPTITMADVGGRVVLREKLSVAEYWNDIRAHGCTSSTCGAPAALLLGAPPRDDDADNPMKLALFGALGPVAIEFGRRFGVTLISNYGSTEIGFPFTNLDATSETAHLAGWLRPGYQAKVVDEAGNDVGFGTVGELVIKAPHESLMMQGYLGHPELTAKVLVDGWYHTGDGVILYEDFSMQFVDRLRDTLRRFGENISSTQLESIINANSDVLECAVVGVPSEVAGHEVLLIVRPSAKAIDPSDLYDRLREQLPKHCLPAFISFRESEFPKTPNGKIRKVELRDELDRAANGDVWTSPSAVMRRREVSQSAPIGTQ